jgi:hypothetical protein
MLRKGHWANSLTCSVVGLVGLGLAAIGAWICVNSFFAPELRDIPSRDHDVLLIFEPKTVLEEIDSQQANVFQLVWQVERKPVTPPAPIPTPNTQVGVDPVVWTEADFERVALASFPLLDFAQESVPTAPYGIGFTTPCQTASIGPQRMEFDFWSEGMAAPTGKSTYLNRRATVDARRGRVVWHETELSEASGPRQLVNSGKVAAEVALRAAEAGGGQVLRNQLADDCSISGTISSTSQWRVTYWVGDTQQIAAVIEVDATSGDLHVLVTPAP